MKAVSMENQAAMLNMANKTLKHRILRLEHVGAALKEGVKKIQAGQCACDLTVGIVRQTSRDYYDPDPASGKDVPSYEVISKSKSMRDNDCMGHVVLNGAVVHEIEPEPVVLSRSSLTASCSSEEDIVTVLPRTPPRSYKTALDVINETIVKTLDTPLNLVKSQHARQSLDSVASSSADSASVRSLNVKLEQPEVDSSMSTNAAVCIANANGTSLCRGELLNLNKLTCYLDLISRKVVKDDGASAMERAIIKSRLKIPFWSAETEVN